MHPASRPIKSRRGRTTFPSSGGRPNAIGWAATAARGGCWEHVSFLKRIGLLEAFLLFVTVLFVVDAAIGYRAFVSAGERASREALIQASDVVVDEIDDLQFDTEALLLRLADRSDPRRLDFLEPGTANSFLMWYLRSHPHITSVNYGDSLGNAYLILLSGDRWSNRIKKSGDKGVVTWVELSGSGASIAREVRPDEYDARTRPWYIAATEAPGIRWSPPYVLRTTRDPGITASMRIEARGDAVTRVVGVDVLLSDFSRLLAELNRETPGLAVWVVSDQGQVLASSDEKTFLPYLEREPAELPAVSEAGFGDLAAAVRVLGSTVDGAGATGVVAAGGQAAQTTGFGLRGFESAGERFYGLARAVGISEDLGLTVVVMVPRGSLLSYFESAGRVKILLFLLFAILASVFFVGRYVIPLRRLTRSVRTFGTESYVPLLGTGRTDEVGVLLSEFERMADDLDLRQRELTESEARYRNLFESVQDGVFETGSDGRFVRANRGMAEIFGVASAERIIGRPAVDFWGDPGARAAFLEELESRKSVGSYRSHSRRQDGTPVIVEVSAVRLEGPAGEFLGTEGIMRDVTESAEAADAMRRAAEEWRTTFDSMSDLVSVHDGDFRIVKANAAMSDFFGLAPAELVGRSCHQLYHGSDTPCSSCPFPEMADSLLAVTSETYEAHLGMPMLMTVSPILGSDGRLAGCVHVARDVSERRRLEEQLRQSQKMEAIGRLAGGVAHDFNNMLSVIGGFTEEALAKIGPLDPAADDLREVRSAAERSANLTRQLLAFSRRQPIEPKVVDLNERLRSMEGMLRRLLGEDVMVEFDLSQDLWPVRVDLSQMDQVLANLAANSRDAMPEGGTLRVESGNVTLEDLEVETDEGVAAGDYVMLSVSDDGQGMDHETLRHVFEPFFTTKGEGRGTGLGLATVYGAVKQNGGTVDVDSAPGVGTTVRVYLPRYRGEAAVGHVPQPVRSERTEMETVLLVEDERQVRRLVRTILGRLGYDVLEAEGPEEALALCAGYEGRIDLLLTDVVMPVMNGKELQERVSALLPGIKTLFMSGYTADSIASRGALHEGVDFLEKPFSPDQLGRKVREVLDRR